MILSLFFILISVIFAYLIEYPVIILIIVPIVAIITYYEQKSNISPPKYSRFVYIFSLVISLGALNFWIIPLIFAFYLLNVQIIVFCILFYIILQFFIHNEYFKRESIIIVQHLLIFLTFIVFAYSFFPILSFEFPSISNQSAVVILNVLTHFLIILSVMLSLFYYLFLRHLLSKDSKVFNVSIVITFLLIELVSFSIINIMNFFRQAVYLFLPNLFIGINVIPIIYLGYSLGNFALGIIPKQLEKKISYYLLWMILILSSFSIIWIFYPSFQATLISLLIFSFTSQLLITIGWKFAFISESSLNKLRLFFLYVSYAEIFLLAFTDFYNLTQSINIGYPILSSLYFSLLLLTLIHNIAYNQFRISKTLLFSLNVISLLFTTLLIFLLSMLLTLGTYYILIIPILFSCIFLFMPLLYIKSIVRNKSILNKSIIINFYIVSMFIVSIPYLIAFEMIKLGYLVDFVSTVNFSIYIIYSILLVLYAFSRILKFKENRRDLILKVQVVIEVIVAFTTIFYYLNFLLKGTAYEFVLPILATSAFLNLPFLFSYKRKFFSKIVNKITIILNTLILWGCIISLPSLVAIQIALLGFIVDLNLIILISFLLIFSFLLFLNMISNYLKLTLRSIEIIKIFQLVNWTVICVLLSRQVFLIFDGLFHNMLLQAISISISLIAFLLTSLVNLPLLEQFKQTVFENRKSRFDYYKIHKIYEYWKNCVYFIFISVISLLLSLSLEQFGFYTLILSVEPYISPLFIQIAIFSLFNLLFLHIKPSLFKIEFQNVKLILEMICWFSLKINLCILSILIPINITIVNRLFMGALVFSILSPISIYYLNKKFIILESSIKRLKQGIVLLFLISIVGFFAQFYWLLYFELALITVDQIFIIINTLCIIYLYLNFTITHFRRISEEKKSISFYKFFGINILLLSSMILINSLFFIFFLLLIYSIILYNRNRRAIPRIIAYLVLTIFCFNELSMNFDPFNFLRVYATIESGLFIFLMLASLISVLIFAIIINTKKKNFVELRILYIIISLFIYITFLTFTSLAQIYSISISTSILLILLGISSKRGGFKWFIGSAILLLVFNFVLFLSESFFFASGLFQTYKPVLSYTLTFSLTGILFIGIFRSTSGSSRKFTFFGVFGLLLVVIPNFIYFFLISIFSLSLFDPVVFIISANVFIFLFYVSIAIYQGGISWRVWRAGWWLWILCPLINFYIIYEGFTGIDLFTSSLSFFGLFNINGSFIISVMICVILSLPFWHSWIKKYFSQTLLIVWGLSLFAIYWLSQNIFASSLFFTNFIFVVFAVFLLIPILFWMKLWRLFSIFWTVFTIITVSFLVILFNALGFLFEINYSLNIIIAGGLILIASFFPTFRAQRNVILILSYTAVIIGIFLTIFYINYFIFLNLFVALAISLITMGVSLFTSRVFKLKQYIFNLLISIAIIAGLSLLTFSTFSLIPGFEWGALFLTMTVAGFSFFAFNHYKMIVGIQKLIPTTILSLGISLTLSSFVLLLLPVSYFLAMSIFTLVNISFLYYILYEKRFVTLYLIPIPITLFLLEFLRLITIFQPVLIFILITLMLYTTFFQVVLHFANPNHSKDEQKEYRGFLKMYNDQRRIKVITFVSLILNSTYFSIFISFISQLSLLYQILEFLIVWSILILLDLRYFRKWELDKEFFDIASMIFKFGSFIALLLYFEITIFIFGLLLEVFLIDFQVCVIISLCFYFTLSLLDIHVIKQGNRNIMHILNIGDYIFLSVFLFLSLIQFLYINVNLLFIFIIIILLMQFYTNYAIFNFLREIESINKLKLENIKEISKNLITNSLFLSISLYAASFLTILIQQAYPMINLIPVLSSYIMIFSFLMYLFNIVIKTKYRSFLTSSFFISFQVSLIIFWISLFGFLNLINLFNISLLLILETICSFYSINLISKLQKENFKEKLRPKIYAILSLFIYLEISLLTFSVSIEYLNFYGSLLISQVVLFFFSLFELKKQPQIKIKITFLIRSVSYFTISLMFLILFIQMFVINLSFIYLGLGCFSLMQFYSNYLYYKIRKDLNPEKESIFLKWKRFRERFIGISVYILIISYLSQVLLGLEVGISLILFVDSLIAHGLMLGDKYIFKLMKKYANIFIIISWCFIFGFSVLYFSTWIAIFSFRVIPIIVLLLLFESTYLYLILPLSKIGEVNKMKIKKALISLYYLDLVAWPIYYINLNLIDTLSMILMSMGIIFVLLLIDKKFGVLTNKLRKKLLGIDFSFIGVVMSLDLFFFLEFYMTLNFYLNISIAFLLFMLFMSYLIKPFKRKKILSFAYWITLFVLSSLIMYNLTISGLSWGFLLFGAILYPFIFMLEELKLFIQNVAKYIKIALYKIKNGLITLYYNFVGFLKRNFKYIKIFICLGIGALTGLIFSDLALGLLNPIHSTLLSLSVFGLFYGLIPSKKAVESDEIFEQKMKRFITIWISTSLFIYVLILPYIESFVYSLILMTSSILGLSAILLIFIYRKEKRQKISIKWRFYTTIIAILLVIVWIILIVVWYFTEVRV